MFYLELIITFLAAIRKKLKENSLTYRGCFLIVVKKLIMYKLILSKKVDIMCL